jgi:hypothetical protein
MQPPSERRFQVSTMSNVSGAWTGTVGCNDDSSFHALKRTPATYSPDRPVDVSGTRRPLQVTT